MVSPSNNTTHTPPLDLELGWVWYHARKPPPLPLRLNFELVVEYGISSTWNSGSFFGLPRTRSIFFFLSYSIFSFGFFVLEENAKKRRTAVPDGRDTIFRTPASCVPIFFSLLFCCVRDARSGVVSASQFFSGRKTSSFFLVLVKDKKTATGIPYPIPSSQSHAGCVIRVGSDMVSQHLKQRSFFVFPRTRSWFFLLDFLLWLLVLGRTKILLFRWSATISLSHAPAFINIAQYETY